MVKSGSLPRAVFNYVYFRTFRSKVPGRLALVNDEYAVYAARLLDPRDKDRITGHEIELLNGIDTAVRPGDDVVIIGGGFGVSTLSAADIVGENGSVTTFEASGEIVTCLEQTVQVNDVGDCVTVRHGAVGPALSTWGATRDPPSVDPEALPACDVIVMDCEGAEQPILDDLTIRPRHIVVEYHPPQGVAEVEIRDQLDELGYDVVMHELEDPEAGIGILTAEQAGGD